MGSRKTVQAVALATALGVGAVVAVPAIASAHGGGRGGGKGLLDLDVAADVLGVSEDELEELLSEGDSIADVAEDRGVDLQSVIDALVADADAEIDEAVEEGDLDADRAEEISEQLPERTAAAVERDGGFRGGRGRGRPHGGRLFDLDVAADVLGVSEDELEELLSEGDSIADVAEDRGVDLQSVIDALVADADAEIDEAVEEGDLDADDAERVKAEVAERIPDIVDLDGGFGRRGGPGGPRGPGGPGGRPRTGRPPFPRWPGTPR